jgi:hypothetical protein
MIGIGKLTRQVAAFLSNALDRDAQTSSDPQPRLSTSRNGAGKAHPEIYVTAKTICHRLAAAKAYLDHVEAERQRRGDPRWGKATEDSIVWSELLDLELQDVDEQMRRIYRGGEGEAESE